ncbi:MAG: helix-turn-helix domain-containing protein [Chloroflexota bacterium]|nr:helix-turn-helix domain-containing protein [Chloroflexota bacterium]
MVIEKKDPLKKARLSEEQITEIMRLKREGKSISAIAQIIGCHRQTVRMHLKERHGDIVAEEARKQVLVDELRSHFQELASFAAFGLRRHLDASRSETPGIMGPIPPIPGPISVAGVLGLPVLGSSKYMSHEWRRMYELPPRDKHLMQALREHIRDSDLWIHWDSWRKEVANYETMSRKLLQWVINRTEPERWQKINPEDMDSIRDWLFGNILLKTSGAGYEELEIRGRELITSGTRDRVARAAGSAESKPLYDWLWDILKEAETLPEGAALESATVELSRREKQNKLKDIIYKIDSALDGIEMMRAFPGRCHLCPV